MKTLIIAVAASAFSLGAFAASHAEKAAMAKPAASAPAATKTAAPAAKPAAKPAASGRPPSRLLRPPPRRK